MHYDILLSNRTIWDERREYSVLLLAILYDIHIYSYNNYIIIWLAKTDNSTNCDWIEEKCSQVKESIRCDDVYFRLPRQTTTRNTIPDHKHADLGDDFIINLVEQ